jgi:hypothetical protein
MPDLNDFVTPLIPVAEWEWYLYRVSYQLEPDGEEQMFKYIVSTPDHIHGEVCEGDNWPNPAFKWASWGDGIEKVSRPRQVGQFYGCRIDESGWEAGRREAKKRGLI